MYFTSYYNSCNYFWQVSKKRGFFFDLYKKWFEITLDKNLKRDSKKIADEVKEFKLSAETINNFAVSFANQIFKYRFYGFVFALIPTAFILLDKYLISNQNILIKNQNVLIEKQNTRIKQQTHLQEAERRSSYVFLMSNILDNLQDDLKEESAISETTQSRLIALSSALKPYKYLNSDSLTEYEISIEKGYLFKTLFNLNIPSSSINPILSKCV